MTAYRQRALICAAALQAGPLSTREVRVAVPDGPTILLHNVYGWFARVERGIYALTTQGKAALACWPKSAYAGPEDAALSAPGGAAAPRA